MTVCIVVNGEKVPKSPHDLDLNQTMPKVELVPAIFLQNVHVSSRLDHYFLSYRVHTHTHTRTHRNTNTHTADRHEYSIAVVDKPQL